MISKMNGDDDQRMDMEEDYSDYYTDIDKNHEDEMDTKDDKNQGIECNECLFSQTQLF